MFSVAPSFIILLLALAPQCQVTLAETPLDLWDSAKSFFEYYGYTAAQSFYSYLVTNDDIDSFMSAVTNGTVTSSSTGNVTGPFNTVLVPNAVPISIMDAISNMSSPILSLVLYNVVLGNITSIAAYPNNTILTTALNDSSYVTLEAGKSQVMVFTRYPDDTIHVLRQPNDTALIPQLPIDPYGFTWFATSELILIPGNLSSTASSTDFNAFATSATSAGILDMLESQNGITIFVPQDSAIQSAPLSQLSTDELAVLWKGHAISGTYYSPQLANQDFTSLASFQLSVAADGITVTIGGGNSAKIVTTDVLLSNGVVHIIDGVLESSLSAGLAPDGAPSIDKAGHKARVCVGLAIALLASVFV